MGNGHKRKRTSVVYGHLRLKETCAGKKKKKTKFASFHLQNLTFFRVQLFESRTVAVTNDNEARPNASLLK